MSIGIGGAGSKLASLLDNGRSTIIDVSGIDLDKVDSENKLRAVVHSSKAQLNGSRKDPEIGREAYLSIKDKIVELSRGNIVFCSAGGGTGNGISSVLLEQLSDLESVKLIDKTLFFVILPYPDKEASEFIDNSISFLEGPISKAIDAGNTGNIILASNKIKFEQRIPEKEYNRMLINSLYEFLTIPEKGEKHDQLDGNIDYEDFTMYKSKPYFNHFCHFDYNIDKPFKTQLESNYNSLLLMPDRPIEALFLLEIPSAELSDKFYNIIDYFTELEVAPYHSVILNPELKRPYITVSLLYSRKPLELVESYNDISSGHKRNRVKKSLDQFVTLTKLEVNLTDEAKKVATDQGQEGEEIINVLKRIGKL